MNRTMGLFKHTDHQLKVEGMTCGNCVEHVRTALLGVDGVKKAEVDLAQGGAWVRTKEGTPKDTLIAAVKEAGYEARGV